tara:strand:- start:653 stop:1159 length:507 start_codon:yes stop_codon:yes gene_type:complete
MKRILYFIVVLIVTGCVIESLEDSPSENQKNSIEESQNTDDNEDSSDVSIPGNTKYDSTLTCEYEGDIYNVGDIILDEDNCNSKTCLEDTFNPGITYFSGTSLDCGKEVDPNKKCVYDGVELNVGDSVNDGCNTCSCSDDPSDYSKTILFCTQRGCGVITPNGVIWNN